MCLAVPGKVVQWLEHDPLFARALVEFAGTSRECHMACVPDAKIGDYVVVHAGIALSIVDKLEASRMFSEWENVERAHATLQNQPSQKT